MGPIITTGVGMLATKLVIEPSDVIERLRDFGTTREDIAQVALAAMAARNDSVAFDPKTAPGQLAYIYGVRSLRERLVPSGYDPVSRGNIESAWDRERGRKVMLQTVDVPWMLGQDPEARHEIGQGKTRVIERSTGFLFREMEEAAAREREAMSDYDRAEAWYVCVAYQQDSVTCELSRPSGVEDGKFTGFEERIFILGRGVGPDTLLKLDGGQPPTDIKPIVSRRG